MASDYDPPVYPSIYFGETDIDQLARFDSFFREHGSGAYSRSDEIKRAMITHRIVEEVMADVEFEPATARDREALIRQAMYDHFRD